MSTDRIVIVGAGGHARVVADALLAAGAKTDAVCFADDNSGLHGTTLLGCLVLGAVGEVVRRGSSFHVAVGNAEARQRLQQELRERGANPVTILHPRAVVSAGARIGSGTFVAAGAIVAPLAIVGDGVIINHQAIVDHDCEIGDWTHVAPHATLGGGVRVSRSVLVGANATVLPSVAIGTGATIGAGAVVTRDVEANAIYRGVPARPVRGVQTE